MSILFTSFGEIKLRNTHSSLVLLLESNKCSACDTLLNSEQLSSNADSNICLWFQPYSFFFLCMYEDVSILGEKESTSVSRNMQYDNSVTLYWRPDALVLQSILSVSRWLSVQRTMKMWEDVNYNGNGAGLRRPPVLRIARQRRAVITRLALLLSTKRINLY